MPRIITLAICLMLLPLAAINAQEVLLPLQYGAAETHTRQSKSGAALQLPFLDDFSNHYGQPSANRWATGGGWVEPAAAANPPTIGMLTLDAINADGQLYSTRATIAPFPADTVASLAIRTDSLQLPIARGLQASDSVALSFYYLPGGGTGDVWRRAGDSPNTGDSLILELLDRQGAWRTVWATDGTCIDSLVARTGTDWQYVHIALDEPFLHDGFRFRFRNYCSFDNLMENGIVGNCDQWHIDYIQLDYNRKSSHPYTRDVAFVAPAPSLLKNYQAMPARQYRTSEMADYLNIVITNRYEERLAARYEYYETSGMLPAYDGGLDNVPPFMPDHAYQTAAHHAQPPVSGAFPADGIARCYHIVHTITEAMGIDDLTQNDTLRFDQHIEDYYAYDDGTAENGYGVYSQTTQAKMACQFALNTADTLSAVSISFNRTRGDENEQLGFYLCVWADNNGRPGELIYQDQSLRHPSFDGIDGFVRYRLDRLLPVSGTIYVGLTQTSAGILNIGFDRHNDASRHTFYHIGNGWTPTFQTGALMLRPYFGQKAAAAATDAPLPHIAIYPNPAASHINIDGDADGSLKRLYDMQGRCVLASTDNRMSVEALPAGIYMLRISVGGQTIWRKIAVTRH